MKTRKSTVFSCRADGMPPPPLPDHHTCKANGPASNLLCHCESGRAWQSASLLAIITAKPTTMNEITDCRGWRPRHPVRRQAAVRYAEKSAHRGPIFPTGRRRRRPLQRRSFVTMTEVVDTCTQSPHIPGHRTGSAGSVTSALQRYSLIFPFIPCFSPNSVILCWPFHILRRESR